MTNLSKIKRLLRETGITISEFKEVINKHSKISEYRQGIDFQGGCYTKWYSYNEVFNTIREAREKVYIRLLYLIKNDVIIKQ